MFCQKTLMQQGGGVSDSISDSLAHRPILDTIPHPHRTQSFFKGGPHMSYLFNSDKAIHTQVRDRIYLFIPVRV